VRLGFAEKRDCMLRPFLAGRLLPEGSLWVWPRSVMTGPAR
jgi:hypothetical protein